MIGSSLTLENLQAIYTAMSKVAQIDRSNYFNDYYKEIEERIEELRNSPTSINITLQK